MLPFHYPSNSHTLLVASIIRRSSSRNWLPTAVQLCESMAWGTGTQLIPTKISNLTLYPAFLMAFPRLQNCFRASGTDGKACRLFSVGPR